MKRLLWFAALVFALGLTSPVMAQGSSGVVVANVNLFAGPDPSYPPVTYVPAGTYVAVQGCTQGWGWCDVITMGTRGWIAGTYIQYTYQNQPVVVADYGAAIGIPIIAFSIGAYWDTYYRGRPFYGNRNYWYGRRFDSRPPPRPPGYRPGGPGYRPGPAHRPPQPAHRPPAQNHRPPQQNNRPQQGNNRPPQNHARPAQNGGNKPKPQNRPAPKKDDQRDH